MKSHAKQKVYIQVFFLLNFVKFYNFFSGADVTGSKSESKNKSLNERDYYCDICKKTLSLSPVEILKHKRSHSSD